MGFSKGRPDRDRFSIAADRLLKTLEPGQGEPEELVRVGGALVDLDGAAEEALCILEPPLLQPQQAQTAQRIEMTIVSHQDHLIELLGLAEAAAIVQ